MITAKAYRGHSADVRMELLLNGAALRIAQFGPDFLIPEFPLMSTYENDQLHRHLRRPAHQAG